MRITDSMLPPPRPTEEPGKAEDVVVQISNEEEVVSLMEQLLVRSTKALNRNLDNVSRCKTDTSRWAEKLDTVNPAQNVVIEFMEQVQAKSIRWQMWAQQVRHTAAVMTHCRDGLPPEKRPLADATESAILFDLRAQHSPPPEITEEFDLKINSGNDFFDKLLELIDLIKNGYLAGYEHIIAVYSEFFAAFNEAITSKMKDWITGTNDGKEVILNATALKIALAKLMDDFRDVVLFPPPGREGASKEEAQKWLDALGLPASSLKDNGDGTFSVVMDIGPLNIMFDSVEVGDVKWDTAKFQAWQTGFNAQEERMKNMLQSFTQKYSNANSYHDNFNKTLSSHLSQYADMLKAMLNF